LKRILLFVAPQFSTFSNLKTINEKGKPK